MQCKYAMKANAPTLRADINHLERVQRLATRLVRRLRHVPYEGMLRQFNLFSLERRHLRVDLILAYTIFKGEVDLNPSEFFLRPPRAGVRGHTCRILQGPSRIDAGAVHFLCVCREILEQIAGASSLATLSVYL